MVSEQRSKWILRLLIPVFIAVLSFFVLSRTVPEMSFVQDSLESVEDSRDTVMKFTGATLAASVAISALPDDFASPIADSLAGMNKYFVFILIVLLVERLILVEGIKLSFLAIIPIGCILYVIGYLLQKGLFVNLGKKLGIIGLAIVLVIPCSSSFANYTCADYMAYIDETIEETEDGSNTITEITSGDEDDQTIFEKLSGAFKTAIQGVKDLLNYFNNLIKKCINSIAIMIVTTFVIPMLNLFIFKWLLGELFHIQLPTVEFPKLPKKPEPGKIAEKEETV